MRFAVVRGRFAAVQCPMQWCETDLHDCKRVLQWCEAKLHGRNNKSKLNNKHIETMKKIMLVCAAMFTLAAMTACKSGISCLSEIYTVKAPAVVLGVFYVYPISRNS